MTTFAIDCDVYKLQVLFVVSCSHKELNAYLRKHFRMSAGDDIGQCGQMFTFQRATTPLRVVWVEQRPRTYRQLGTLLHEIFHLVTRICQDKGIPIKAQIDEGNGDEAAAYLYDFFSREAIRRAGVVISTRSR